MLDTIEEGAGYEAAGPARMLQFVELAQRALDGPEVYEEGGGQRSAALGMLLCRLFRLVTALPRRLSKVEQVGKIAPKAAPMRPAPSSDTDGAPEPGILQGTIESIADLRSGVFRLVGVVGQGKPPTI